ncbi:MAG: LD-carboxypeptidase [Pseudomonadota bacterium]
MKRIILLIVLFTVAFSSTILAKPYNKVALISSSTQYNEDRIERIKQELEKKGYIVSDKYLNQVVSDFGYVNTDRSRANTLVSALLDDNMDIIWFVRGGGGAFNLIPDLYANREKLKKAKPKIIVGFSDVTAIHYFVNNVLNWPSVHGVVASFNKEMAATDTSTNKKITINDREDIPSIKNILTDGVHYKNLIPLNKLALQKTHGILVGGNFTLIQAFFSTLYACDFSNKILILEDTGVSFRQLDRSLHQLLYNKNFNPKAIIFGQFYPIDSTDEQRLMYKTVIKRFAEAINIPIYYFPFFGHGRENKPFILWKEASINCPQHEDYCLFNQINQGVSRYLARG